MKRRDFITLSGTAGLAAVASTPTNLPAAEPSAGREFYELRQNTVETEDQKKKVDAFLKAAAIPALNRIGLKQVGVFYP